MREFLNDWAQENARCAAEADPSVDELLSRYACSHPGVEDWYEIPVNEFPKLRAAIIAASATSVEPIPMLLFCPACGTQHIDAPDEPGTALTAVPLWENPPHRSHKCHACGCIWRPADVPTTGVASINTCGKADSWDGPGAVAAEPAKCAASPVTNAAQPVRDKTCACGYSTETSCNVLDPTCKRNEAQDEHAAIVRDNPDDIGTIIEATRPLQVGTKLYDRASASPVQTAAARDVLAERERQKNVEGWTPEHDDEHDEGQLSMAACGYASRASDAAQDIRHGLTGGLTYDDVYIGAPGPEFWPHGWEFKAATPRRMLVKAGALILAEIERLDRAAAKGEK